MESVNRKAFLLLVVTFFFWGSIYVAGKMIAQDVPPQLLAGLRCFIAMAPLLYMSRGHRKNVKIAAGDRKYFAAVGFLGYFMTISLVQLGISLTGASMASLINALTPVVVTVAAAVILKERITPLTCLCLALALAGAAVITSGASGQSNLYGMAAVFLSVFCWGFASVFIRRLGAKYPPVLVTTCAMASALLFHLPASIYTALNYPFTITPKVVMVLLYLGFIGSGVSQYTWSRCLAALPAATCSLFYPLQPVFSAILGALLLKETFHPSFFAGLFLISADVALVTWDTKRRNKNAKQPAPDL